MKTALLQEGLTPASLLPRIQNKRPASQEILRISSHYSQSMHQRRCSHQAIRIRQPFAKALPPPLLRDQTRDRQNPVSKLRKRRDQPLLKNIRLFGIILPLQFDSITDFAQAEHAEVEFRSVHLFPPSQHVRIRAATFADFGEDIRVQQETCHHSSGGRLKTDLGRSNKTSSSTSESAERWSLKSYRAVWPTPRSCSAKIRRCSSSLDTPCAAARSSNAFTKASGISLTNN
jgi:hypothetical protein